MPPYHSNGIIAVGFVLILLGIVAFMLFNNNC